MGGKQRRNKGGKKNSAEDFKNKGNQFFSVGDFSRAIKEYANGLNLEPNNAPILSNMAAAYIGLHQYEKALEVAQQCKNTDSNFLRAYVREAKSF